MSDKQIEDLAKGLVDIVLKFYEDSEAKEGFEKWLKERKEKG